jgi:hypothetical protein
MLNGFAGFRQLRVATLYDKVLTVDRGSFEFYVPKNLLYVEIFLNARDTYTSSPNNSVSIVFNNDSTAANYRSGYHRAAATHTYTGADDNQVGLVTSTGSGGSLGTANQAGTLRIHIYDPSNDSFFKEAWGTQMVRFATNTELWSRAVVWKNTAPITRIQLLPTNAALYVANSRCTALGWAVQ